MATVVIRLDSLLPEFRKSVERARGTSGWDPDGLRRAVSSHFDFLGPFVEVQVLSAPQPEYPEIDSGEWLVLAFEPPAGRDLDSAERRFQRATRDAERGRLRTALPELTSIVEQFPEIAKYRRALGQAFLVSDDLARAEDEFLGSLALNPNDPSALTLLGNLYVKQHRHRDAIPLYERSLALEKNVYALNNLGAVYAELGDVPRAIETLREASTLDPTYPNTWFGIGLAISRMERLDRLPEAIEALDRCLAVASSREITAEVFDTAQRLLDGLSKIEAREELPRAQDAVRRTLAAFATNGGPPVQVEEQKLSGVLAKLETAWVHRRPNHRLLVGTPPEPAREHHVLHELQHLQLIEAARAAGTNRWFSSTAATRERAIRSMEREIKRIAQLGIPEAKLTGLVLQHVDGLSAQLFNFPIDLLIESRLLATYPDCRELFYQSIKSQLELSRQLAHSKQLRDITPKVVFRANTAMNGAFALWFEEAFPRRTGLVADFQRTESWPTAKRLLSIWKHDSATWSAGKEYDWVDSWAEILGLRDWYLWSSGNPNDDAPSSTRSPSPMSATMLESTFATAAGRSPSVEASGPLDADRATASMFFMLGAMEWADRVSREEVARVAASAAMTGQTGIEYLDPESRYDLPGYASEPISGLQLLSAMYVLIKRLDPTLNQGIDLEGPYAAARQLYEARGGGPAA